MSGHILINILNKFGKRIKCKACQACFFSFAMILINSIIKEHDCYRSFITRNYNYSKIAFMALKRKDLAIYKQLDAIT